MKFWLTVLVLSVWLAAGPGLPAAKAGTVFAVWDQPQGCCYGDTVTGTIGARTVALSNLVTAVSSGTWDLSGADFSAAPGPSTAQTIVYLAGLRWSFAVTDGGPPIPFLYLYTAVWRGPWSANPGSFSDIAHYTFSLPFTVVSGEAGSSVNGQTISMGSSGGYYSGILQFSNVTSLTLTTDAANLGLQGLTFASGERLGALGTPEPASVALIAFAAGLLALLRRKL